MELQCINCEDFFDAEHADRKFCSRECFQQRRIRTAAAKPHKPCEECGNLLTARQQSKGQRFCGRKCFGKSKTVRVSADCKVCGTSTKNAGGFCSRSCSASFNNVGQSRNKKRIRSYCTKCGEGKGSAVQGLCDPCRRERRRDKEQKRKDAALEKWFSGDAAGVTSTNGTLHRWAVRAFKDLGDNRCECGWQKFHPVDGAPGVQLDHINGNHADHRVENLRLLCPECHWATDTYCGRNNMNYV